MVSETLCGLVPRAAVRAVEAELAAAGCPDADFDAMELCRMVIGRDPRLALDALTKEQADRLAGLTTRRAAREPLQYLAGEWDFLDLTLRVGPGVLCPRADSEVVCETAIELLRRDANPAPRVLDLCAGTGCLGLGVQRFVPHAAVTCVEKSDDAFRYLAANTGGTPVAALQADVLDYWRTLTPGSVDLILCNPPYLTAEEMTRLMPETAREPAMALDGGRDGLDFYRAIAAHYRDVLRPGGRLVFEIGCAQREAVRGILSRAGWTEIACRRDYGGNDRVLSARRPL